MFLSKLYRRTISSNANFGIKSVLFLSSVFCLLSSASFALEQDTVIRVAIEQGVPSFYLKIKGNYEIHAFANGHLIRKGKNLRKQKVLAGPGKIVLEGLNTNVSGVQIVPLKGAVISVDNRIYRGKINLIGKDDARMVIVNEVAVEDYVQGILGKEIAPWWPMEALKAQGIIARSYALYQKQFPKDKEFDLTDDIYSQVYGGKTSETWRTNRAVSQTKRKVLTLEGKVFPTYYHATCGGHTEDALALWKVDLVPLKGVVCNFCSGSPHFSWQEQMPLTKIQSALIAKGFPCPQGIEGIEILERNQSGRAVTLRIKAKEQYLDISAKDFRQAIDPNVIRSTNFIIEINEGVVFFRGLGWGHGVGLCQWGMYFMAKEGYTYEQILQYYFPHSEITSAASN